MKSFALSLALAAMMMGTVAGCSAVVSVDDEPTEIYTPDNDGDKKIRVGEDDD